MADIILKNVPLAWMDLWEPTEFKPGDGKPRYNLTVLVAPGSENDKLIRAAISQEMTTAYGAKAAATLKGWETNSSKNAYLPDDGKYDFYDGRMSLAAHRRASDGPPMVLNTDMSKLTGDEGKPYRGCLVNVRVSIYVQGAKSENPGVRASFSTVQYAGQGEEFGGSKPATAEGFESLADGADAEALIG